MGSDFEPSTLKNYLGDYYKSIFPFKPYCQWLSYGKKPSEFFHKREFAFILEEDVHLRYRSFANVADFEKELCKIAPHKLDVGAIYNHPPAEGRKLPDFNPLERELVFDIDLTDYDDVRTCCSEAKVCAKCWKFVEAAVMVLDRSLRRYFGFEALLWVFSGRRGVHCWVADERARRLSNKGRAGIADHLSLISGEKMFVYPNKDYQKKAMIPPVVNRSYRRLMQSGLMDEMVIEQGWLEDESEADKTRMTEVLDKIHDVEYREKIVEAFQELKPEGRWEYLKRCFDEVHRKEVADDGEPLPEAPGKPDRHFLVWFVLWHVYPRLDVNVSTGMNHLLKSPFCIHPKTGNVAVPLDVKKLHRFDLKECPRIDKLVNELRETMASDDFKEKENRKILGYKHTSLAPYVETFQQFVNKAIENCSDLDTEENEQEFKMLVDDDC